MFASRASLAVELASMTSIWWFKVLILGSFTELLLPNRFIGPRFALFGPTRIRGNPEREAEGGRPAFRGHSGTLAQPSVNTPEHDESGPCLGGSG